jgi:catechol 2,3-dioxygenase-like lactoylglutathione lyase family enzyme
MSGKIESTGIVHVRLFASEDNWQQTVRFYQDVLGFTTPWKGDEAGVVIFKFGRGPTVSLERVDGANQEDAALVGRFCGISFGVDSLDDAYAALLPHCPALKRPEKMDWGGSVLHFHDPSGNELTLVQYSPASATAR